MTCQSSLNKCFALVYRCNNVHVVHSTDRSGFNVINFGCNERCSVMIHVAECTTVSLNKSVHVICIFCSQHLRFLSLQQDKRPSDRICTCTQRKISLIQQNISLLLLKKKIKLQKKISLI